MNTRSPHRRCTKSRPTTWVGALLVLMSLLGRSAGALHELSTTHVRCAEHGELMHVESVPTPAKWQANAQSEIRSTDQQTEGTLSAHDHCALAFTIDQPTSTRRVTSFLVVESLPQICPTDPVSQMVGPASYLILSTAPKTSPPVA